MAPNCVLELGNVEISARFVMSTVVATSLGVGYNASTELASEQAC